MLSEVPGGLAAELLTALEPSPATALLMRLEDEDRNRLLAALSPGTRKELQRLMAYPAETAGRLMDPQVASFRPEMTAQRALSRLRRNAQKRTYNLFLTDSEGRLGGVVALQDLAVAKADVRLGDLARAAVSVNDTAARDEVVEILERDRLASLPVIDFEGRLLGVIRLDVLVSAVEREVSADMQSMVGASREERALSNVSFAVSKRLPWLQINLATAFLAASVVGLFEGTIARFTALAVLLPVVAGQSGNTGAQALAVAMRGLALREITLRHWPRLVAKELSVGALNGVAVALVTCIGVYFWSGSSGLTLVIGVAMVTSMAIAGVAGAAIPVILSAIGQDPAQSSSIILTTVTDVFGFFSFLGLATLLSGML